MPLCCWRTPCAASVSLDKLFDIHLLTLRSGDGTRTCDKLAHLTKLLAQGHPRHEVICKLFCISFLNATAYSNCH